MEPRRLRRDRTRTLLAELPLTDVSEVLLCQFRHHRGQQEYSDEVGDGHKAVEGIGDVPGDLQLHGCAHDDDQREDNLVNLGGLMAQQELPAAGAVQSPGQNRGQGEQRQAHSSSRRKHYQGLPITSVALIIPIVYQLRRFFPEEFPYIYVAMLAVIAFLFVFDFKVFKPDKKCMLAFVVIGALIAVKMFLL